VGDETYYNRLQTKFKSEKSCKIDLFNHTPKPCEGTEVNRVREESSSIDNTCTWTNNHIFDRLFRYL